MRIRELKVTAFGALHDFTLEEGQLASGVNVVCGPNEAGKTTLLSVCRALLYGFYPVKDFPYRPWHRDVYPEIEAALALEDARSAVVWRKLMSAPQGTVTLDGETYDDLRNRDLPFVQHLGRGLYDALYSLTLADMDALEGEAWQDVEDRLLGGLGSDVLRPVSQVLAEVGKEADSLWRSDNRGKPKCRELANRLSEVRSQYKEAREKDRQVRESARELGDLRERLDRIADELPRLRAEIRQAEQLLPLKQRLEQIEQWRGSIPDEAAALKLPDAPRAELSRTREAAEQQWHQLKSLLRDKDRLENTRQAVTPEDESLLARADEIRAWMRSSGRLQKESEDINHLEAELEHRRGALREAADDMLARPWRPEFARAAAAVAPAELKGRINRYQERADEHRMAAAQPVEEVLTGEPMPAWYAVVAGLTAGALLVVGVVVGVSGLWGAGIVALLLALLLWMVRWHQRRQRELLQERRAERLRQIERQQVETAVQVEEARQAVTDALAGLPVVPALLEKPDLGLLQKVEKLRGAARECDSLQQRLEQMRQHHSEELDALNALLQEVGCPAGLPGLDQAERLLADAEERQRKADDAAERIVQILDEARRKVVPELRRARQARGDVIRRIRAAVPRMEPLEEAAERAAEIRKLADRVRETEEELQREHPDLEDLKAELRRLDSAEDETLSMDVETVERIRQRAEDLQEERQQKAVRAAELEKDIAAVLGDVSVAELRGEIVRIEEEIADAQRQHDRLALLESILRCADAQFRSEHQPDVLKRAGRYLREITQGRYGGLQMMPDEDGVERLAVILGDGPQWRSVEEPLSGGTRNQIYLAFRLAVVDHLDEGQERLPLFLDEVFVNWDSDRSGRAAQLLAAVGRTRQVFVLTCHPQWARRVREATGGALIELTGA